MLLFPKAGFESMLRQAAKSTCLSIWLNINCDITLLMPFHLSLQNLRLDKKFTLNLEELKSGHGIDYEVCFSLQFLVLSYLTKPYLI